MAEILESFNFKRPYGNSTHPWSEWTDGKIRRARKGTDFVCGAIALQQQIQHRAKKLGMKVITQRTGDDVVFQFVKPKENGKQ